MVISVKNLQSTLCTSVSYTVLGSLVTAIDQRASPGGLLVRAGHGNKAIGAAVGLVVLTRETEIFFGGLEHRLASTRLLDANELFENQRVD